MSTLDVDRIYTHLPVTFRCVTTSFFTAFTVILNLPLFKQQEFPLLSRTCLCSADSLPLCSTSFASVHQHAWVRFGLDKRFHVTVVLYCTTLNDLLFYTQLVLLESATLVSLNPQAFELSWAGILFSDINSYISVKYSTSLCNKVRYQKVRMMTTRFCIIRKIDYAMFN